MKQFTEFLAEGFPPKSNQNGPKAGGQKPAFGAKKPGFPPKKTAGGQGPFPPSNDGGEDIPASGGDDNPFGEPQGPEDPFAGGDEMLGFQQAQAEAEHQQKMEAEKAAREMRKKEEEERQITKKLRAAADLEIADQLNAGLNDEDDTVTFYPDMLSFQGYKDAKEDEEEDKKKGDKKGDDEQKKESDVEESDEEGDSEATDDEPEADEDAGDDAESADDDDAEGDEEESSDDEGTTDDAGKSDDELDESDDEDEGDDDADKGRQQSDDKGDLESDDDDSEQADSGENLEDDEEDSDDLDKAIDGASKDEDEDDEDKDDEDEDLDENGENPKRKGVGMTGDKSVFKDDIENLDIDALRRGKLELEGEIEKKEAEGEDGDDDSPFGKDEDEDADDNDGDGDGDNVSDGAKSKKDKGNKKPPFDKKDDKKKKPLKEAYDRFGRPKQLIKRWMVKCPYCKSVFAVEDINPYQMSVEQLAHVADKHIPTCPKTEIRIRFRIKPYYQDQDLPEYQDAKRRGAAVRDMLGTDWKVQQVEGVFNDDVKCGAKCRSSKGPSCECSCGGENHGSSL